MKKLVSFVVAFLAVFLLAAPKVDAAGAITADEQRILDTLRQPVVINGKSFSLPQEYLTQAENHLKQENLTAAEVSSVIEQINAATSLLASQTIDMTNINTIDDLIKALPRDVITQIQAYVTKAANVLGITVDVSKGSVKLVSKNSGSVIYDTAKTVKQTGVNYFASFVMIGALLVVAAGAFVVGKKTTFA